jgi:ribonuclease HI
VLMRYGEVEKELCGGEANTTNNRMEMLAVISGLEALKKSTKVRIVLDSQYVQKGMNEWIHGWKARGWKTAAKQPVKNVDLWQRLDLAVARHEVQWQWVKGHAGHEGNERADQLANKGIPS